MSTLPITSTGQLTSTQQRVYQALQQVPAMIRLQRMMEGAVAQNQAKLDYMRANGREPAGVLFQRVAEDRAAVDGQRRALREIWDRIQTAMESAIARGWVTPQEAQASGVYGPQASLNGLGLGQFAFLALAIIIAAAIIVFIDQWRARSAATQAQQVQTAAMVQSALNAANFTVSQGTPTPSNPTGLVITPMPGAIVTPVAFPNQPPQTPLDRAIDSAIDSAGGATNKVGIGLAIGVGVAALLILPRLLKGRKAHG